MNSDFLAKLFIFGFTSGVFRVGYCSFFVLEESEEAFKFIYKSLDFS